VNSFTPTSSPALNKRQESGSLCGKCGTAITSGKKLTALGRDWHEACFTCAVCNTRLLDDFYEKDGEPFCARDYDEKFLMNCKSCGRKIEGSLLKDNKGGQYHPSCFTCGKCRTPLGTNFFWADGVPVCESCGTTKAKSLKLGFNEDRCGTCRQVIQSGARTISAGGNKYHEQCFTCTCCKQPVASSGKAFQSHNGFYACEGCISGGKVKMCEKCGGPVLGKKVNAVGKDWHEECFKCAICRTLLSADSRFFVTPGDHDPICSLCQSARK